MPAPEVAARLGTSLPTVHRLLDEMGVTRPGRGVVRPVPPAVLERMTSRMDAVPEQALGLDRTQLLVLTAVARAGLGLESNRAVARVAGVSPTTAAKSLAALAARGLVSRTTRRVVRGTPQDARLWTANVAAPGWSPSLRRAVKATVLPVGDIPRQAVRVPRRFAHLFWNADLARLDVRTDGAYIAHRLLDKGDVDAWAWAVAHVAHDDLRRAQRIRGLDQRAIRFVDNVLAKAETDS
ncbi:DUF6922 domain-containing protein [Cellulomonas hominis]